MLTLHCSAGFRVLSSPATKPLYIQIQTQLTLGFTIFISVYTDYIALSMAPRRSQAATVAQNEGSSSAPLQAGLETDRLTQGLVSWNTDGQETVKQILSTQTDSENAAVSTIPLSNTLIKVLESDIGVEDITKCLQTVTESWETERKDVLWEALVDSVVVLSEAKEDSKDLKPTEGMEVDGQTSLHPADKGIQIIKSLLVSLRLATISASWVIELKRRTGFKYHTGSHSYIDVVAFDPQSARLATSAL